MKKLVIAALLTVCTTSAFARYSEYHLWIADQEIQPLAMNKTKLEAKFGTPSIRKPNTLIWNKGNSAITANFKGDALDSIYVTGNWDANLPKAIINNGKKMISNGNSGAIGYISEDVEYGCQYSELLDKEAQIVRFVIKVPSIKDTSMIYGVDTNKPNQYVMNSVNLIGWKNEPMEKNTRRCFNGPKA